MINRGMYYVNEKGIYFNIISSSRKWGKITFDMFGNGIHEKEMTMGLMEFHHKYSGGSLVKMTQISADQYHKMRIKEALRA